MKYNRTANRSRVYSQSPVCENIVDIDAGERDILAASKQCQR